MNDNEQLLADLEDLLDSDANLSSWEMDFVSDITTQLLDGRELTENQRSKCREILDGQ